MPIYLQHGNLIDYVPPTDTSTEDVVFMGGLVGIPQTFIPAGELGALSVDGVYMFTKKDGVSVNLGDVVKYCGTTKLAQDNYADLTLGVAVADADADSLGVKVKINSVLPTDGGGGGGGLQNLATGTNSLSILGAATTSEYSVSIGSGAQVSETSSGGIAIGCGAEVSMDGGAGSIAIGVNAKSQSPYQLCGNIVIGDGINPYSDSALLIIGNNGDLYGTFRKGILFYSLSSNFPAAGVCGPDAKGGGIAYVTSTDKGENWTLLCSITLG